jgi:hypothetical protein
LIGGFDAWQQANLPFVTAITASMK